jgi:hypothetical protein
VLLFGAVGVLSGSQIDPISARLCSKGVRSHPEEDRHEPRSRQPAIPEGTPACAAEGLLGNRGSQTSHSLPLGLTRRGQPVPESRQSMT